MPPQVGSRYTFCEAVPGEDGRLELTEREPYGFFPHPDNRTHVVVQGDTLFALAGRYFTPLPRACGFWWVLADYQPEPIVDATIPPALGRALSICSLRVLTDVILGESRRTSP